MGHRAGQDHLAAAGRLQRVGEAGGGEAVRIELLDDGLAYVKEGATVYAEAKGNKQGAEGLANFPDSRIDAVVESAEECPGECIFIEP